jgi:hypothetical protein
MAWVWLLFTGGLVMLGISSLKTAYAVLVRHNYAAVKKSPEYLSDSQKIKVALLRGKFLFAIGAIYSITPLVALTAGWSLEKWFMLTLMLGYGIMLLAESIIQRIYEKKLLN